MERKRLFLYALQKSIPVMLGYVFLGAAFGIVLHSAGMSWIWAVLISGLVYAGSMQFALVPLIASGASLPTVALMTLMVNSRHLFYGLSFVDMFREMGKSYPYMVFSLTDETYSVLCACRNDELMRQDGHRAALYLSGLHQFYWVLGSAAGALAGELIAFDTTGIDFSMTALFVVILVDQLRGGGRDAKFCAAAGLGIAAVFLLLLGADAFLLPTLACTVLVLWAMSAMNREVPHE